MGGAEGPLLQRVLRNLKTEGNFVAVRGPESVTVRGLEES